jgi:hypothetical protein
VSGIAAVAPRAYWNGYLRLSLVSCPVQLFPAISERGKIRFHQINRIDGLTVSGYAALYALALNLPSASCSRRCSAASLPREARTKPLPAITGSMSLESVGSPAR